MEGKMPHRTRQQGFYVCLGHSQHTIQIQEEGTVALFRSYFEVILLAHGYCKAMKYEKAPPSEKWT